MRTSKNNWEHQNPPKTIKEQPKTPENTENTHYHPFTYLGKANLPKELENPLNMSQMLRGFQKYISLRVLRDIRLKLISRLEIVNLLKVLGNLLTESQLLKWFQKHKTLTVFREIRFKLLSRLGKVNLLILGSLLTESHVLRGFRKYVTLRVWKEIRMKLLFRFGKANLLEILQNLVTWITIAERISKIYNT